jgi:hypothetical protein
MLPMLFGGGEDADVTKALKNLQGSTDDLGDKSKVYGTQGASVLNPALEYLRKVVSGDRQELLAATMPERRRVIDQYDAAKKATAEFAPRGGGTAGAMADLNARQAGDLAATTALARREGVESSVRTGSALEGLSVNANEAEAQNLNQLLNTYMAKAEREGQSAADFGMGLASILGMVLL